MNDTMYLVGIIMVGVAIGFITSSIPIAVLVIGAFIILGVVARIF